MSGGTRSKDLSKKLREKVEDREMKLEADMDLNQKIAQRRKELLATREAETMPESGGIERFEDRLLHKSKHADEDQLGLQPTDSSASAEDALSPEISVAQGAPSLGGQARNNSLVGNGAAYLDQRVSENPVLQSTEAGSSPLYWGGGGVILLIIGNYRESFFLMATAVACILWALKVRADREAKKPLPFGKWDGMK